MCFVSSVYYATTPGLMQMMDWTIPAFYVKFALMNYVKLYSCMTVTDLIAM